MVRRLSLVVDHVTHKLTECGLQKLWCLSAGLVALQHVGSYFPDWRSNLCPLRWKADSFFFSLNGRQILNHWTTRDVQELLILLQLESGEAQGFRTSLTNLRTLNIFSAYVASFNPYPYDRPW